jgi:hypothetical protein
MKRLWLLAAVAAALSAPAAAAAQQGMGVGVIVGEPTGISFKTWLTPETAFDLAAAWSFVDEDAFHVHGDFLLHNNNAFPVDKGMALFYYGVGGRVKAERRDARVGIRIPLGAEYLFARQPIDLFLEVVPILDIAPATDLTLNAGLGVRYFFH